MASDGKIPSCENAGCGHVCCTFQQGNYIVLYPGEFEEAQNKRQSISHLVIIDDNYHGGKKAICKAKCTSTCDGGFKPLDCASYPFFPEAPEEGVIDFLIKGKKCPLQRVHLQEHAQYVRTIWNKIIEVKPEVARWLAKVKLVGYSKPSTQVEQKKKAVGELAA